MRVRINERVRSLNDLLRHVGCEGPDDEGGAGGGEQGLLCAVGDGVGRVRARVTLGQARPHRHGVSMRARRPPTLLFSSPSLRPLCHLNIADHERRSTLQWQRKPSLGAPTRSSAL